MKVTVFGAAFDPPHLGHQKIALSLLEQGLADSVWLLPVKEHAFGKKLAPENDRLAMVELLAEILPEKNRVERWELDQKGTSYTYQTLQQLSTHYPEHTFSFVIGSDNLARFHEWQDYEQMLEKFPFFVYPRKGFPMSPIRKGMIVLENVEPIEVSSTQVRDLVAKGRGIDHLVPNSIHNFIIRHNLYIIESNN